MCTTADRRLRQQQRLKPVLLLVLLIVAGVGAQDWDSDGGSSWSNRGGSRDSDNQFRSSDSGDTGGGGGPPPSQAATKSSDGSHVGYKNHAKNGNPGPLQGFSGGFGPRSHRCTNPNLPGCESCSGDVCTACYIDLGIASFTLNRDTNQCVCPPGFGKVQEEDMTELWSRRLLSFAADSLPQGADNTSTAVLQDADNSTAAVLLDQASLMGLQTPPPPWATDCLPCPVNYYSPGGSIGFAECKPCPGSWTTGNATAAADCLVPYCNAGQEPNRRTGRCRLCLFGFYRPANSVNTTCTPCPPGYTTPARGSTSMADCRVPICLPGQQLDMDLFICKNCTGNTISAGGVRANGPYQPFCQECPTFTAAVNRTLCLQDACPPPDAFSIKCRTTNVPQCGPGAKPFVLDNYCTAYPPGSVVQWVRATISTDNTTASSYGGGLNNNFTTPAVAYCPAGANGTNVWWPFITSFNGRTNCLCTTETSCRFQAGQASSDPTTILASTHNPAINITLFDPQLTSLRWLLGSIAPASYTKFAARLGRYCIPDSSQSNGLLTSCLGPYIYNITYTPSPAVNGTLPPAVRLPGLSHLRQFTCNGCGLGGQLPADWGTSNNLLALQYLDLGGNSLTGALPPEWGGLVNLANLTISNIQESQTIPDFWSNMRSLQFANFTNMTFSEDACAPKSWQTYNGLVIGYTLLNVARFC